MNFQNLLNQVKSLVSDPTIRIALIVLLLIPVGIIYFFKIRLWGKKKGVTRRRRKTPAFVRRYRSRRSRKNRRNRSRY